MREVTLKDLKDTMSLLTNYKPTKLLTFIFPKSLVDAVDIETTKELLSAQYGGVYNSELNGVQYIFTKMEVKA